MHDGGCLQCQHLLCDTKLGACQSFQPSDFIHGQERKQLEKTADIPIVHVDEVLIEIEGACPLR